MLYTKNTQKDVGQPLLATLRTRMSLCMDHSPCKISTKISRTKHTSLSLEVEAVVVVLPVMSLKAQAFQQACRTRLVRSASFSSSPSISSKLLDRKHAIQSSLGRGSRSASSSAPPPRRAITVTTDDGRYQWSELSTSEKAARTTQQSFNFLLVAAGAAGTVGSSTSWPANGDTNLVLGRGCIPPLCRTLCCRFQDPTIQCRRGPNKIRRPLYRTSRPAGCKDKSLR